MNLSLKEPTHKLFSELFSNLFKYSAAAFMAPSFFLPLESSLIKKSFLSL
jgi:glycogen synthase